MTEVWLVDDGGIPYADCGGDPIAIFSSKAKAERYVQAEPDRAHWDITAWIVDDEVPDA